MAERIPFNRRFVTGQEFPYIRDVIERSHLSGGGPYAERCEALLREALGSSGVLLTTSCTHALEMAAMLLDLKPGDEVIVPSFTFVSTAAAFALRGAVPVFADIRPDTLNIDEQHVERLLTPRTRAIVPVHYAGVACEMDRLGDLAAGHGAAIVEDNAHGLFGRYRGRALGTLGALATLSFHETKNFTCGEGGALIVNDPALLERAEVLREKGTNRKKFFRGQVDKYTWVDLGSSYVISDILAAYLLAQLEARAEIQDRRRKIWLYYQEHLAGWAESRGVRLPFVPPHVEQAFHMFYLRLPSEPERDAFITHLEQRQIYSVFHYLPLHRSAFGSRYPARGGCPVTDEVSATLVRLPFFTDLHEDEQARVVDAIRAF